jgi:hypothetical protein
MPASIEPSPFAHTVFAVFVTIALAAAPVAFADVTYEGDGNESPTIARLTVTPAAAPVPALRYRLVARDLDLAPGNAAPYYYRAMLGTPRTTEQLTKEFGETWYEWFRTGPGATQIANLPLDRLRKAVELSRDPLDNHVARAVTLQDCDWQLGEKSLAGPEVIAFHLPEMYESRTLGRLLTLRTRLAIAEGRVDDALASLRMTYRLSIDTARPPMLVCGLVGMGNAGVANGAVVELIATPNSPNLYWALTELPQPFIDLRNAARFEASFAPRMFPLIRDAETAQRSPEEWNRLYQQVVRDLPSIGGAREKTPKHELGAALLALVAYPHAKARLIEQGVDRDKVDQMAVGQVIAVYTQRITQRLIDDFEKLWYVPYWEMRARSGEIEERLRDMRAFEGGPDREVIPMMTILLPGVQAARENQVRLDREFAALRVIEALRMYAANHNGQLPERLNAINEVPIPLNPATGQPFAYRRDGDKGILELPIADGLKGPNRRYEITIKR